MKQIILHLDLDAFFASVEQANNSYYVNKPLVVGTPSKRSVVTAASYEAKHFGIKAGMPFFLVKEMCPNVIITPANFYLYSKYSGMFFDFLKKNISRQIEICSIDECNIDITNVIQYKKINYISFMRQIQEKVYNKLKLKVSLGLSFNKEFAKIAANMNKPLGLKVITKNNFKKEIWPLHVKNITGIGKATIPFLLALKINTIGNLATFKDFYALEGILGSKTKYFLNVANGKGTTKLKCEMEDQKSISKEHTFDVFLIENEKILEFIKDLAKNICSRINKLNLVFNVVRISYKNLKRERKSIQLTLKEKVDTFTEIESDIELLFNKIKIYKPFLLISFGVSGLENKFDYYNRTRKEWTIDEINHDMATFLNRKFNKKIVMTGKEWKQQKHIKKYDRFLKGDKSEN